MHRLLIVHHDPSVRALMSSMLQNTGHRIDEAATESAAARLVDQQPFSLVLAGADHGVADGLELLALVRRKQARTPVIFFSASPLAEQIREASQRGAAAFLRFPLPASQLRAAVAQALPDLPANGTSAAQSRSEALAYRNGNGQSHAAPLRHNGFEEGANGSDPSYASHYEPGTALVSAEDEVMVIADDPTMRQVIDSAEAIAGRRSPILIVGEQGSGKKTLARYIHEHSARRGGPFVVFNCSGRREAELEAELLGRPHDGESGLLARVAGGTLFLEDVHCLSPALQAHVLRAVRDAEYRPAGSERGSRVEARLILGCSDELASLVERGQFRSDLFYALSAVTIQLPPLRHRGQDILRLAEHFREAASRHHGKSVVGISPDACRRLMSHEWTENLIELRDVIERAVARCRGHWIEPNHLGLDTPAPASRDAGRTAPAGRLSILPLKEALEEPEKRLILEALRALNWNRQETARVLDINRTTLYKKMKKYGLIFEEPVWAN